jgi:hypothetical protein
LCRFGIDADPLALLRGTRLDRQLLDGLLLIAALTLETPSRDVNTKDVLQYTNLQRQSFCAASQHVSKQNGGQIITGRHFIYIA